VLKEQGLYKASGTLLELGGNIGTQTVYFALSKAYKNIVSVEPDPRNFALLTRNITQNRLQDQVSLVNLAAGESAGFIDFYQNQDNHGKSSAYRQSQHDLKLQVPVKPVREILSAVNVPPADVALIWMDIEGYEPIACRSMQDLMTAKVPLYMEFSPLFYGAQDALAFKNFLITFYQNALVFYEDRLVPMKVSELPLDQEQFDVLFF
jgi:FkbM family methyltransferase